jgi:hypothetical protein
MDSSLRLPIEKKSRTLRVVWLLTALLALFPIFSLCLIPRLPRMALVFARLTSLGGNGWLIALGAGAIGCVALLIALILAFQDRKATVRARIAAALAVTCTLFLWGYWVNTTREHDTSAGSPSRHSVTLTWTLSKSLVRGYNIYRSTLPDKFTEPKLNAAPIMGNAFVDTTVEGKKTYYYVARAVDVNGKESSDSNVAKADVP